MGDSTKIGSAAVRAGMSGGNGSHAVILILRALLGDVA